jgi:hypothetical protein
MYYPFLPSSLGKTDPAVSQFSLGLEGVGKENPPTSTLLMHGWFGLLIGGLIDGL